MIDGIIAIVGKPNVGKSTIFNRCLEQRVSIVDDSPGVTRDRIYGDCEWLSKTYRLIDTGGIQLMDAPFQTEINAQVELAIEEADVIIFACNGNDGVTSDDEYIAKKLHKSNKQVVVAVNKIDDTHLLPNIYDFYKLGFEDVIAVSGAHGIGIGDMLDACSHKMVVKQIPTYDEHISFCLIGRPNVGKSSLTNALLNQDRVIVSSIEGTTRDSIDTPFEYQETKYVVIDTAGIRRRGKVYENLEKYAVLRAKSAIERSDIALVLIDGEKGIIEQDKHVAGIAHEEHKGVIIVYNKWDAVEKDEHTMNQVIEKIRDEFSYLSYAPIAFVSAKNKSRIHTLFPLINEVHNYSNLRIKTNVLNEVILDAQIRNPAKTHNGKRLKIYYASQVSVKPTVFVLFVNDPELAHFSYTRYIENCLRDAFGFVGVPIKLIIRKKED